MSQKAVEGMVFPTLGYANCWEDGHVLCEALCPCAGKRMLSIASGGDNSFILAAKGATVISVDRNPSQIACVQLKRAAIRHLGYEDLLGFMGFNSSHCRLQTFRQLEPYLPEKTRAYWNSRLSSIETGFAHSGKFEGYFRKFCRYIVPLIHRRSVVLSLLEERNRLERQQFYENKWNNLRWRSLLKLFFNRAVMARFGRESSHFRYVEGSVLAHVMHCAHRGMVELPTHNNPFLEYIATGTFKHSLPPYLESESFSSVREGLDRIILVEGQIEDAARLHGGKGFDGFNLSDLFEYMSDPVGRKIHSQIVKHARPGARIAYWNMMAPRRFAGGCESGVIELSDLAATLHRIDRAFFYSAFILEEVFK